MFKFELAALCFCILQLQFCFMCKKCVFFAGLVKKLRKNVFRENNSNVSNEMNPKTEYANPNYIFTNRVVYKLQHGEPRISISICVGTPRLINTSLLVKNA